VNFFLEKKERFHYTEKFDCWRSSMVEQLICNQQVAGSNPIASSIYAGGLDQVVTSERFPSGQREQTVNLSAMPSEVRILPSPPYVIIFKRDIYQ
jgi:hypothetical protein